MEAFHDLSEVNPSKESNCIKMQYNDVFCFVSATFCSPISKGVLCAKVAEK